MPTPVSSTLLWVGLDLHHTIRYPGSWQLWGDVGCESGAFTSAGEPGPISDVACVGSGTDLHVVVINPNGEAVAYHLLGSVVRGAGDESYRHL
jgi:hypothetical protein